MTPTDLPRTCPTCGTDVHDPAATTCDVCGADLPMSTTDHTPLSNTPSDTPEESAMTEQPTIPTAQTPPPPPPGPSTPPPAPAAAHPSGIPNDLRTWGMLTHLSSFVGAFVGFAFLGPLVMWLIKKDDHPFVDHHGKEALNFNLSLLLYLAIGGVLTVVTLGLGLIVFLPALLVGGVVWIVFSIQGAMRANNGEGFRYPLTIRFISD